jgi:hypothetical protein
MLNKYENLSEQDKTNIQIETGLPKWSGLYRISGIAAIVMLILIPIQIAVYTIWPMPASVTEWFQLFQNSRVLGLLHLDVLYIINNTIVAIMYIAFYMSLRRKNEALLLLALLAGLLATAAYYASNPAFEVMSLSRGFAAGAAEPEKTALIAAGQILIAQWKGTSFDIYYILSAICLIIMAGAMFKSAVYGRAMAAIGLTSGILMVIPSTAGTLGLIFSLASLVPWVIFSVLAAGKFLKLSAISAKPPLRDINMTGPASEAFGGN